MLYKVTLNLKDIQEIDNNLAALDRVIERRARSSDDVMLLNIKGVLLDIRKEICNPSNSLENEGKYLVRSGKGYITNDLTGLMTSHKEDALIMSLDRATKCLHRLDSKGLYCELEEYVRDKQGRE